LERDILSRPLEYPQSWLYRKKYRIILQIRQGFFQDKYLYAAQFEEKSLLSGVNVSDTTDIIKSEGTNTLKVVK
jgi:hypothetical protein